MPHVELPQAEFKVVMLGDSDAGKTSLVLRFAEGYYRDRRSSTVGAFFITKRIQTSNGITCKIQIWDTAGQAQFRPMAPMYYRNAAAAIVCYDVTSAQSYKVMTEWLDELHRNVPAGSMVIAIAPTKCDRVNNQSSANDDDETISSEPQHLNHSQHNNGGQPAVPFEETEALASTVGAIYVPTSAKENDGVNDLFQQIAERVLRFRRQSEAGIQPSIPLTPGAVATNIKNGSTTSKSGSQYGGGGGGSGPGGSSRHNKLRDSGVRREIGVPPTSGRPGVVGASGGDHARSGGGGVVEGGGAVNGNMDTYHFESIPGEQADSGTPRGGPHQQQSQNGNEPNGAPLPDTHEVDGENSTATSKQTRYTSLSQKAQKDLSMCSAPFMCDVFSTSSSNTEGGGTGGGVGGAGGSGTTDDILTCTLS